MRDDYSLRRYHIHKIIFFVFRGPRETHQITNIVFKPKRISEQERHTPQINTSQLAYSVYDVLSWT